MNNTKYEVRPVVGYEGLYSVSNAGEVFSHNYHQTGQTKQLKPGNVGGYFTVALCQDGKPKQHLIHRLVLQAFVPNPENKPFCDHIDTNPSNNHVSNLRWVTSSENNNNPLTKARRNSIIGSDEFRKKMSATQQGKNNPRYDKTIYTFRNKSTSEEFVGTMYDFRTKYDLIQSEVSRLIHGKCKSTKGWVLI